MLQLLFTLSLLPSVLSTERYIADVISDQPSLYKDVKVEKGSLVTTKLRCTGQGYLNVFLRDDQHSSILLQVSGPCDGNLHADRVFASATEDRNYTLDVTGNKGSVFEIEYHNNLVSLPLQTSTQHKIKQGGLTIHTFQLPDWDTTTYRYCDVTVESDGDPSIVGKFIATQNQKELYQFLAYPNSSTPNSLRLSFSTFGRLILSDVSRPKLAGDTWYIAVVLFNSTAFKEFNFTVEYNTDYEYVRDILTLVVVSCLGVILPIGSRYIFNNLNAKREFTVKDWLKVVFNWFYRGEKGLSYLTGFLAFMLLVSAFQVVHAKWAEMIENGDRDVCYFNEKCYRPYLGYYDASVNGIASNLCFMVHGLVIIVSVSFSETSCHVKQHKYYNYSIAYSFGMAFIFEGLGSLLYHICPSQIIFQFDTLFMFVISQYIIAALADGHSARLRNDVMFYPVKHKMIRIPKLFLFFLGPAYMFNFLGNLHATSPLPSAIATVFWVTLGFWVLFILTWAAYKLDLLHDEYFEKPHIKILEGHEEKRQEGCTTTTKVKAAVFCVYCVLVVLGYVMVVTDRLVISIFILGELIVAVLLMTAASFLYFMKDIWGYLQTAKEAKVGRSRYLVPIGVVFYLIGGGLMVMLALYFFVLLETTNKSLEPWKSRELNSACMLNDFYDSHDLWHFFASHALLMTVLVVIQMSKPCRDCYMEYLKREKKVKPPKLGDKKREEEGSMELLGVGQFHNEPEIVKIVPLV